MEARLFVDLYEILEVAPSAKLGTIEGKFRQLARMYHPDNQTTGDRARFDAIVEAHETLKHPGRRAQYHEQYKLHFPHWAETESGDDEASVDDDDDSGEGILDEAGIGQDLSVQNKILTLLYRRRRVSIKEPGIGNAELERLTGCPHEHLEFHLWYLKEKGWIATQEDGLLAITIGGVDRAATLYRERANKLITDQS